MWARLLCLKVGANRRLVKNSEEILNLIKDFEFLYCRYEADRIVLFGTAPVSS